MADGWIYQGRQEHGEFGHGTKPKDTPPGPANPALGTLADRIHARGYTLVASLPPSQRYHPATKLNEADHARLDRVLHAAVAAVPGGPSLMARRVFAMPPQSPGIATFAEAARLLRTATTRADVHAANDALAASAQQMGLDNFKPFLRHVDDHVTQTGGVAQVVADFRPIVTEPKPKVTLAKAPLTVLPDGIPLETSGTLLRGVLRRLGPAAAFGFILGDLIAHYRMMAKLKLDPKNAHDVVAAIQYRWALNGGAMALGARTQAEIEAKSLQVMRAVQADPTLLAPIAGNDIPVIKSALDQGLSYDIDDPAAGQLVTKMRSQGATNQEIARALAAQGLDKVTGGADRQDSKDRKLPPPLVNMPPDQLRFSQRTAGFNNRYQAARDYIEAYKSIPEPPDAVRTPDGIVTIDNTRVALAREFGLKTIPVRIWEPNDPIPPEFAERFEGAKTWGDVLRTRVEGQRPSLPSGGTIEIPSLPRTKGTP